MATPQVNDHPTPQRFKHAPLISDRLSTRLVTVLPGFSKDGLVRCRLQNAFFTHLVDDHAEGGGEIYEPVNGSTSRPILEDENKQKLPSYSCLSYTWGDPGDECIIELNDKVYTVRRHLWQFLAMAAENLHGNLFWIDALCIDQTNATEKSHQVQQMGTIYRGAKTILVWLGGDLQLELVLHAVHRISQKDKMLGYIGKFPLRYKAPSRFRYDRMGPKSGHISKWFDVPNEPESEVAIASNPTGREDINFFQDMTGKAEKLLDKITEHEYWSRAWVTQEVLLANRTVVVAGRAAHDLLSLAKSFRIAVPYFRHSAFENLIDIFLRLHGEYEGDIDLETWGLINLLHRFRNNKCTIRRDRIYALSALCTEGSKLKVDYGSTEEQLFRQVLSLRESSMCFCSAAILTNALSPWNFASSDECRNQAPLVEIHMYPSALNSAICSVCSNWVPFSWTRKKGTLFCLGALCPDTQGHIFWEHSVSSEASHIDQQDWLQVSSSIFTQTRANNKSHLVCMEGAGVNIKPSEWKGVYHLQFSLRALVDILQQDSSAGDLGLNACANLWPKASRDTAPEFERLKFCEHS